MGRKKTDYRNLDDFTPKIGAACIGGKDGDMCSVDGKWMKPAEALEYLKNKYPEDKHNKKPKPKKPVWGRAVLKISDETVIKAFPINYYDDSQL